jgi:hypothetical protein
MTIVPALPRQTTEQDQKMSLKQIKTTINMDKYRNKRK